jgi:hypothetical protein
LRLPETAASALPTDQRLVDHLPAKDPQLPIEPPPRLPRCSCSLMPVRFICCLHSRQNERRAPDASRGRNSPR